MAFREAFGMKVLTPEEDLKTEEPELSEAHLAKRAYRTWRRKQIDTLSARVARSGSHSYQAGNTDIRVVVDREGCSVSVSRDSEDTGTTTTIQIARDEIHGSLTYISACKEEFDNSILGPCSTETYNDGAEQNTLGLGEIVHDLKETVRIIKKVEFAASPEYY